MTLRSVLLAAFVCLGAAGARAQEAVTVIRAARVLDGTGRTIPNATVVVRGSRITAVAPNASIPSGARVYDLSTLTLLPGLIDAHDHVVWHFNPQGRYHAGNDGETELEGALAIAGNANATLRAGITTAQRPRVSRGQAVARRDRSWRDPRAATPHVARPADRAL
jgi:imidazolonepropionase-like amidohydrolase